MRYAGTSLQAIARCQPGHFDPSPSYPRFEPTLSMGRVDTDRSEVIETHETWGCCNFSGSEVSVANQGQIKRVSHAEPFVDPVDRVPSLKPEL
jgi:hypothetical protein